MSKKGLFRSFVLSSMLTVFFFSAASAEKAPQAAGPLCADLENMEPEYFENGRFNEFSELLDNYKDKKKLPAGCLHYYKALCRYSQLKYLEEKQSWDDYFANGNTYRDQILENANKAISETGDADPLRIKSRLLLWKFYRDQQGTFGDQGVDDLLSDLTAYSKSSGDPGLIREVADELSSCGEKNGARAVYKIYVAKLSSGNISDQELKATAGKFYEEGNLDLAEDIYDIYIGRISGSMDKEALAAGLFEIAGFFVYKPSGKCDMPYAEKIYEKIYELGGEGNFDQEAIYLRAFNLEKYMNYRKAGEIYSSLVRLYPEGGHSEEALYKIAMIDAYALSDIEKAREFFGKLASEGVSGPYALSSLYQLGLLSQWEGDLDKAKGYYEALLKGAGEGYAQTVSRAKQRLGEIEESKQLDYNLKTFLDSALKKDVFLPEGAGPGLEASGFILQKGESVTVSAVANMPESGCNQVQVQYLWSGDIGIPAPQVTDGSIKSSYSDPGTKEVNLVVVSPAGITGYSFAMLDVR
ncbi:MAG: tetratricopeptide repeat protein [Candidatus Omnitrophica bacterium]|nr:tetratricopeptide repeat protein [Candidatus Omnitrophota bacterium]